MGICIKGFHWSVYTEVKDATFSGAADYEACSKKAEAKIEALKKEGEVVWNNSRLMIKIYDYETHTTTFYEISDISEFKKSGEVKSYI